MAFLTGSDTNSGCYGNFLSGSDKNSGCYGNYTQLPLTYNVGKMKIGIYCYLTADILINILQKCSLRSPLSNIAFVSKSLNLIGCHDNRKPKLEKKILKHHLLRDHKGDKAETLQKCL